MLHLQKQRICSVPSFNINKSIECCSKTYIFLFKLNIQLLKAFYSDRLIHFKARPSVWQRAVCLTLCLFTSGLCLISETKYVGLLKARGYNKKVYEHYIADT